MQFRSFFQCCLMAALMLVVCFKAEAQTVTGGVNGIGFVVLSLLICIGTPFFEELFFRGVILRGLLGAFRRGGALGDVFGRPVDRSRRRVDETGFQPPAR